MRVVLREDVPQLGKSGDTVTVKDGFGRNYLLPKGLAVVATTGNVKQIEHQKRLIAARNAKLAKDAQGIANRLSSLQIVIARQAGEADKLFGSVSSRDIEVALANQGLSIDRKKIVLEEPIKALGDYQVEVRLGQGIVGVIKLQVARQV